ncbi:MULTISPECIES: aldehyde dehydrogenase family protein [unclassified Luteococcus]|uniref:aldehyde dehydrogenase family protein n=1 Tax=unclassified Luteococcus TaxID=2639923 RepID=UPI00313D6DFC
MTSSSKELRAALHLPYAHVDDLYIEGDWVSAQGTERIDVVDPTTEEIWASVPEADREDVDLAVSAAVRAFQEGPWPRMAPSERAEIIRRMADEVQQRAELMAWTNTRENGSPLAETNGAAANAAGILRHFAGYAELLEREDVRPFPNGSAETVVRRDPIGPCALIAPWNFPINLMVIKMAPALLAGCTMVIKPAESTPLSIRFVVEAAEAAGVPAGVINLVTGAGATGDALVRHPGIAKVAFTGSTGVGRKIAAACGELLRPVTLELGGKSSAIVLPDANLEDMSSVLLRSCMRNGGQTCYISTRILAPAERYDEVVEMVTSTVAGWAQGDPLEPGIVVGPSATRSQRDVVLGFLNSARDEGARVTTGGAARDGTGFFVQPTVLADVTPEMRVAREEIFGPVITILRYENVNEAIRIANSTGFGLGGLVFSADQQKAQEVAERMDTGSVGLNFFQSNHNAPFGGRHDSGLGVEYGIEGLHAYLSFKSIHRLG